MKSIVPAVYTSALRGKAERRQQKQKGDNRMTVRGGILILIILVAALLILLNMIRRKTLELRYALMWVILDIILLVLLMVPGLLQKIADFVGIYSVMNLIFFAGFVFTLTLLLSLTVAVSRSGGKVRTLTQELALEEYERIKSRNGSGIISDSETNREQAVETVIENTENQNLSV